MSIMYLILQQIYYPLHVLPISQIVESSLFLLLWFSEPSHGGMTSSDTLKDSLSIWILSLKHKVGLHRLITPFD
jgi:hypothetical protein